MNSTHSGQEKILLIGVDFDGCIFNDKYVVSKADDRLLATNQDFIKHIVEEVKKHGFIRVICMVGSMRQSKVLDDINSEQNRNRAGSKSGSCYPALVALCKAIAENVGIPCEVDGYLLADAYSDSPPGENFAKALAGDTTYKYGSVAWDEAKYTILYAHMHKIASTYPNARISYYFYDDREDGVLDMLSLFYRDHPYLMPHNLTLRLHKYLGAVPTPYVFTHDDDFYSGIDIHGVGVIDHYYHENIKLIAQCCGYDTRMVNQVNISHVFHREKVIQFCNQRKLFIDDVYKELADEIASINHEFFHHGDHAVRLLEALDVFYKNLINSLLPGVSESALHNQLIGRIAKDSTAVLRWLQAEDFFETREPKLQALNKFIEGYGASQYMLKSTMQSCYNMFYPRTPLMNSTYEFANALQVFLVENKKQTTTLTVPETASLLFKGMS